MRSLADIAGRARIALIAVLALVLAIAPVASAHALPCHDTPSLGTVIVDHGSPNLHGGKSKARDMRLDRCCSAACNVCSAIVGAVSAPLLIAIAADHDGARDDRATGIAVGPPHGPPRS